MKNTAKQQATAEEPPVGLWAKILWVMARVDKLEKTGHNKEHNYHYVEEAAVLAQVRPLLVQAGLVLTFSELACTQVERTGRKGPVSDITRVDVEFTLVDADTGDKHSWVKIGYGQDSLDKGPYKALTGATKYAITKTFMMSTGDDPERDGVVEVTHATADQPEREHNYQRQAEDPLDRPVSLATLARGMELAKNALLPPSERKKAQAYLSKEGRSERKALECIAALETMASELEAQEEAALRGDPTTEEA